MQIAEHHLCHHVGVLPSLHQVYAINNSVQTTDCFPQKKKKRELV
jgi:hypothetical protein